MILDISPIGWFIVVVFYALATYALVLLWVRWKGPRRLVVVVLGFVAIALPLADEIWIGWHFKEACKGAGVQVLRKVEADGFLNATSATLSSDAVVVGPIGKPGEPADFEKAGYRFRENLLKDGRVSHLERRGDRLMVTVLDRPEARYHYKQIIDYKDAKGIHNEELVTLKIERAGEIVVDAQTGETIGRNLFYKRRPGWVDSLWVGFFGSGLTICPDPEKELRQPPFPGAVFIPTSK